MRPGLRPSPHPAAAVQELPRSATAPLQRSAGLHVALLVRPDAAARAAGDAPASWRRTVPYAALHCTALQCRCIAIGLGLGHLHCTALH